MPSLFLTDFEVVVNSSLYFSFGLEYLKQPLAARGCFKYARPNEKYRFEFTTASKNVKDRLGIKE